MATYFCRDCAFWKPDRERTEATRPVDGECRRNAPRLQLARYSDDRSAVWPPTGADDWCGEYRPDTLPLALETKAA